VRTMHERSRHLLDVVHVLHRIVGFRVLGEANESESTATAGVAVLNHDLLIGQSLKLGHCRPSAQRS
jgi:hypothetical protein